MSLTD